MPADSKVNGFVCIHVVKLLIFSSSLARIFSCHILAPGCRSFDSFESVSVSDAQTAESPTHEEYHFDPQWLMNEMLL